MRRFHADEEARGVMEQRVQNLATAVSSVYRLLSMQPAVQALKTAGDEAGAAAQLQASQPPLCILADADKTATLWSAHDSVARRLVAKLESVYGIGPPPRTLRLGSSAQPQQAAAAVAAAAVAAEQHKSPARAAAKKADSDRRTALLQADGVDSTTTAAAAAASEAAEAAAADTVRVPLWNPQQQCKIAGSDAPVLHGAAEFLLRNPHLQLYGGQDIVLEHLAAEAAAAAKEKAKAAARAASGGAQAAAIAAAAAATKDVAKGSLKDKLQLLQNPVLETNVVHVARSLVAMAREYVNSFEVRYSAHAREGLLELRKVLRALPSTPRVRNAAAADVLLLLGNTRDYSAAAPYATVIGLPVQVQAREVGLHVPKVVLELYKRSTRGSGDGSDATAVAAANALAEKRQQLLKLTLQSRRKTSADAGVGGGPQQEEQQQRQQQLELYTGKGTPPPALAAAAAAAAAAGAESEYASDADESQATTAACTPPSLPLDWRDEASNSTSGCASEQDDDQQQQLQLQQLQQEQQYYSDNDKDEDEDDSEPLNTINTSSSSIANGDVLALAAVTAAGSLPDATTTAAADVAATAVKTEVKTEVKAERGSSSGSGSKQELVLSAQEAAEALQREIARGGPADERVAVWHTTAKRRFTGKAAPTRAQLPTYFADKPHMQVSYSSIHMYGSIGVRQCTLCHRCVRSRAAEYCSVLYCTHCT
jgi:Protein SET DOMAIN GROUP 2 C-terminal